MSKILDKAIHMLDASFDFSRTASQYIDEINKYLNQAKGAKSSSDVERIMQNCEVRLHVFINNLADERNIMQTSFEKALNDLNKAYASVNKEMFRLYQALESGRK